MGKHSTPCRYVQVHHWCRLRNSPAHARSAVPCRRWVGAPLAPRQAGHQATTSPAPPSPKTGWQGPYGRMGLGEELDKRHHTEPQQSPACEHPRCLCPSWAWSLGVTQRCPGVWARDSEGEKWHFLTPEHQQLVTPHCDTWVSCRGGSPSCGWRSMMALPAKQTAPSPWHLQGAGFIGQKVTVFQSRVSICVRFDPEESQ